MTCYKILDVPNMSLREETGNILDSNIQDYSHISNLNVGSMSTIDKQKLHEPSEEALDVLRSIIH